MVGIQSTESFLGWFRDIVNEELSTFNDPRGEFNSLGEVAQEWQGKVASKDRDDEFEV